LSKHLVSGVDVWLNNPIYPLEASGTSGMKAGMNGVLNLSVLDGWWGEGYEPGNGWAIRPAAPNLDPASRDREEARTLYEILQDQVIPLYYARDNRARSPGWIAMQKSSIATLLPRFNASRMLNEYIQRFYLPAEAQGRRFAADNLAPAAELNDWKARVRAAWPHVELKWLDTAPRRASKGERIRLQAAIRLSGLRPDDVRVELLFERAPRGGGAPGQHSDFLFAAAEPAADGWQRFVLDFEPPMAGQLEYSLRAYPFHTLLAHRFEMGLTTWA
jgi:starch phosphorylase